MIILSQRIKQRRAELGLSQWQCAVSAGTVRQAWQRWEQGKIIPKAANLADIAKALKCSADWLLGLTDNPDPK